MLPKIFQIKYSPGAAQSRSKLSIAGTLVSFLALRCLNLYLTVYHILFFVISIPILAAVLFLGKQPQKPTAPAWILGMTATVPALFTAYRDFFNRWIESGKIASMISGRGINQKSLLIVLGSVGTAAAFWFVLKTSTWIIVQISRIGRNPNGRFTRMGVVRSAVLWLTYVLMAYRGYWEMASLILLWLVYCAHGLDTRLSSPVRSFLWLVGTVFVTLITSQIMAGGRMLWEMASCSPAVLPAGLLLVLFLFLLPILLTRRTCASFVSISVILIISLANSYVYRFRGNSLLPADFASFATAMNVASGYNFLPDLGQWCGCMLFASMLLTAGPCMYRYSFREFSLLLPATLVLGILTWLDLSVQPCNTWDNVADEHLYVVDLVRIVQNDYEFRRSVNYSAQDLSDIEARYPVSEREISEDLPTIIVIMNESFADLRKVGSLNTEDSVMPFFDSLQENTVKGYALSSVFGGSTSNSEYEFLTGNSCAFIRNINVYQTLIHSSRYSIAYDLQAMGYKTTATHPYLANGWRRTEVWPFLGFSQTSFLKAYPQEQLIRGFVSDLEMYDSIISAYEESLGESPLFLYGVTMQNHGGYNLSCELVPVALSGDQSGWAEAEQYLSLIQESDRALEYLISYFQKVSSKVVLVFYGDHLPGLNMEFYKLLSGNSLSSLEYQELLYTVPFLIWANYDIPEQEIELTSLNYLSRYVYQAAGLDLPPYLQFLEDMESLIPAINALGYYSAEDQQFKNFDSAQGKEAEFLHDYELLNFNYNYDSDYVCTLFSIH